MLSVSNVGGGQAASGYYQAEGYYIAGSQESEHSTEYFGQAAKEAGLVGQISNDDFANLLDGQAPNGQVLGRWRDGEREHRSGIDLTFSAPKSVSILGLVGGEQDVVRAHVDAVKTALTYIEQNVAQFRTAKDGVTEAHTGGKMIVGMFHHDTSRALDPQLHTHAVITNMIQGEDGKFRALHNDQIYHQKMAMGQLYRNALSKNLERLGLGVVKDRDGLIEIADFDQKVMETFSKRRAEIVASLENRGTEQNAKTSALAALATRASKKPIERDELTSAWSGEMAGLGIDPKGMMAALQERAVSTSRHLTPNDIKDVTTRAVTFSINHLSEQSAVYSHANMLETALKYDTAVDPKQVVNLLSERLSNKDLYAVTRDNQLHYTDSVNIKFEQQNVRMMKNAEGQPSNIDVRAISDRLLRLTSDGALQRRLSRTSLTEGQKDAVAMSLSSEEGTLVGIQGLAGTGKTYMMSTTARLAISRGYQIEGIAPSKKAVSALNEAIPKSRTIESALTRHEAGAKDGDKKDTILVIDEASMLSSKDMNRVLHMADAKGYSRVVLMGDVKQLDAVGAGSAFRLLQERGLPVATMTDIQRQNTDEGRKAVLAAVAGDIAKAMNGIAKVVEVGEGAEARALIAVELADRLVAQDPAQRENTAVIVMTNQMRIEVNETVQAELIRKGELKGAGQTFSTLAPENFTQAEAGEVRSYKVGHIISAPVAHKASGMEANALYEVVKIEAKKERLILNSQTGEKVELDLKPGLRLAQKLAVYEADKTTVYAGDKVKFRITDRDEDIHNSFQGTVEKVSAEGVTISSKEGEAKVLPADSLAVKGMQLAYSATAHDFQGSTVDKVLLGMVSSEMLATQKGFYVALSRMRAETQLVTDNLGKLTSTIADNTGVRINGLEALADEKQRLNDLHKTVETERSIGAEKIADAAAELSKKSLKNDPEKGTENSTEKATDLDKDKDAQRDLFGLTSVEENLKKMDKINERLQNDFQRPQRTR